MTGLKYFVIGGLAATLDLFIFFIAITFIGLPWLVAGITSFVAATVLNYFLSVRYAFESEARFSRKMEFMLVFAASGAGLIINLLLLWLFIEKIGYAPMVSKVLATAGGFFWNYNVRKNFIFKAAKLKT